ncbi:MAG TPA: anaerobic ribonucleoside-triphosphate reductase, partial [Smithella sp.]|nr:anaerobic ribonucleoside-triphosphate reductase [Smithella sp.]
FLEDEVLTHIQLGKTRPDGETLHRFIQRVFFQTLNGQVDFNPEFTFCRTCEKIGRGMKDACSFCGSADVENIARLTKYFSRTSSWNRGKLAELGRRKVNGRFED